MTNPMLAGLSGDDLAQAQASDANLQGIIDKRREHAQRLLAPPEPKANLTARWSARLHPDQAVPVERWGTNFDGANYYQGEGPPSAQTGLVGLPGDYYQDTLTDTIYQLEA